MGKKNYTRHLMLLLACWVGMAVTVRAQRTDTTAALTDSTVTLGKTDSTADDDNDDTRGEDTSTVAALKKFSLRDATYTARQRKLAQDDVNKITSDDAFWYANKATPKPAAEKQNGFWDKFFTALASKAAAIIFWIVVAACFIAILAMYLANTKVWFFAPKAQKIGAKTDGQGDADEANIFETDFETRIGKALAGQDYRLATRLLFLRVLRSMAEKSVISYSINKTNMDYLFELGNTKYFKDFLAAARNYEYVWYGNFNIGQSQFLQLKQRFDELNTQIKN